MDIQAYIDHLVSRDVRVAMKCYLCNNKPTGIYSDGYNMIFICDKEKLFI